MTMSPDVLKSALDQLSGPGLPIAQAAQTVPSVAGLYAVHADPDVWDQLDLVPRGTGIPLYIGKTESSFQSRDIRTHFGIAAPGRPLRAGLTGGSTVRRSFAALLRGRLDLVPVPRNLVRPERFANFALAEGGDTRLSDWMHANLTLRVWPRPDEPILLRDVEREVIRQWTPPINIDANPAKDPRLLAARAVMAAGAAQWARDQGHQE